MNHHEHAQEIFAQLLAAKYIAHKAFPEMQKALPELAQAALLYAKTFAEVAAKQK